MIVEKPVRQKLPQMRDSKTFSFRVADCHGYATVGEFEDGRPGELFLKVAKQGSTLAGIMDGFAISVSLGLQFGVPLEAFVEKFTNVRFEPAGMTDDRDLRFATSLRRLHLPPSGGGVPPRRRAPGDRRAHRGRAGPADAARRRGGEHREPARSRHAAARGPGAAEAAQPSEAAEHDVGHDRGRDRLCHICGDIMQRAGSCYACPSCGTTSGCS